MSCRRFTGSIGSSYADMEREESRIAIEHFRAGNLAQGEIHLQNALIFARCDGAELAEKAFSRK